MKKRMRRVCGFMLLLGAATAAWADPLLALLPNNGVPSGWARRGEPLLFAGSELYRHIDGGAELYHRHGFERLAVQDYAKGSHDVRVEIYKMNDPDGSEAVFGEMTAGLAVQASFGTACVLDDYQVLFRRGAFLVSLTTYEKSPEFSAAMAALAGRIDWALSALEASESR
ncbi:MAG: hypothetical protein JXO51_06930 [Candidatus Aminicenantes bacterium]|nr:hypothetical protein [Candidatus Aminicenantes bacterium]